MKFNKNILLSIVLVFSVFSLIGLVDALTKEDSQFVSPDIGNKIIAQTEVEENPKKRKTMIENMRENGEPEFVIEHTIEMFKRHGHNIEDWVVFEN